MGGYEFTLAPGEIGNLVDRVSNKLDRDLKRRSPADFAQKLGACWRSDAWNDIVITAQGGHIRQEINGQLVADIIDPSPSRPASGLIALKLLSHSGGETARVYFKDIRVKPLPPSARTSR